MEQVRFIIRMDRNGRKRDEAELALAPAEDWLKQQGISILMLSVCASVSNTQPNNLLKAC